MNRRAFLASAALAARKSETTSSTDKNVPTSYTNTRMIFQPLALCSSMAIKAGSSSSGSAF